MNKYKIIFIVLLLTSFFFNSCKKGDSLPPIDENVDLDGTKINDSSLLFPQNYLLSAAIPSPSGADLAKPVLITSHDFSATNFEWTEFRDWAKSKNEFLVSLVLSGGHGRDYSDFKKASWEDWQAPIIAEYNKLEKLGYKNINIVGSSTGAPLILNMIRTGKVNTSVLKHIFFIDPNIVPANKQISLISAISRVKEYTEASMEKGENGYWYKFLPTDAIHQMEILARSERKEIENVKV